jgi:hypothetical protein
MKKQIEQRRRMEAPGTKVKLNILVATHETQGERSNDFCFAIDNEPVYIGFTCDRDVKDPDGGCGCGRSFVGMGSGRPTTTAKVVESEINLRDFQEQYVELQRRNGWIDLFPEGKKRDKIILDYRREARELLLLAAPFKVGSIVERRLSVINTRKPS